ncbi:MAG: hypothetical protein ACOC22_03275 [bacterium]
MFNEHNEYYDIMEETRKTYEKIQEDKKHKSRDLLLEHKENWSRVDKGKDLFEEYDPEFFEKKMQVDMLFYEQLLEKLDENNKESVEELCGLLYKKVNKIYEFINVNPELYGGLTENIIEESVESKYKTVSKLIYEYLDNNFYNLSTEKRKEAFFEASKEYAKKLIAEGNDINESIEYGTKVCVMEGLINKIAFPFAVNSRINYLLQDSDYGAVFDQEELRDLVESFHKTSNNLARVIAACV